MLETKATVAAALTCLLASGTGLRAQAQQKRPPGTVRVETRLVLVDVVVADKKGNAVTGLRQEDFVVREDGRAQEVAVFEAPATAKPATPKEPLPPHVYTNETEAQAPPGPLIVVLLDCLNTPRSDQALLRQELLAFLDAVMKSGQRAAVLALTDRLLVLQDFTAERDQVRVALEKFTPQSSPLLGVREQATGKEAHYEIEKLQDNIKAGGEMIRELANMLKRFNEQAMAAADKNRAQRTLAALRVIEEAVAGYPGRKNLIWASGAFPPVFRTSYRVAAPSAVEGELRKAVQQLNDARVAIYPVDPRGLVDATLLESYLEHVKRQSDAAQLNVANVVNQPTIEIRPSQSVLHPAAYLEETHETMEDLARDTGGRAFYDRNDIGLAAAHAAADGASYYTLGYYPSNGKMNGRFRQIEVQVPGKSASVRHRRGYFAPVAEPAPVPAEAVSQAPSAELSAALQAPWPATALKFRAFIPPPASAATPVRIELRLDHRTFPAASAETMRRLDVSVVAAAFAPGGKFEKAVNKHAQWPETTAGYAELLKKGMVLPVTLELPPGEYVIRLLLRDNHTGLLGRVDAPLTIPAVRPH
jgi:VWFA-related protein